MVLRPESTILSIKRLMGGKTSVLVGGRSFTPEEISALILKELKQQAEKELGQTIREAVITVPAYFADHQRKATLKAGELAGLKVRRLLNEPTAAALAYDVSQQENQTILVYDLGGGTFDVSLVQVEEGIVEVKASHGDTHLGGDDFDQLLLDHVADHFQAEHDIDLRADPRTPAPGRRKGQDRALRPPLHHYPRGVHQRQAPPRDRDRPRRLRSDDPAAAAENLGLHHRRREGLRHPRRHHPLLFRHQRRR